MITLIQQPLPLDYSTNELPERHELVGGAVVEKAMPSYEHGDVQGLLRAVLHPFYGVSAQPGGWWFSLECEIALSPGERYLPDLAGWRIDRVPQRPSGRPVAIVPDWVCEILSPSTAERDLVVKKRHYHRAKVEHYWLIDVDARWLNILRWAEAGYEQVLSAHAPQVVKAQPFTGPDFEIDLDSLLGAV